MENSLARKTGKLDRCRCFGVWIHPANSMPTNEIIGAELFCSKWPRTLFANIGIIFLVYDWTKFNQIKKQAAKNSILNWLCFFFNINKIYLLKKAFEQYIFGPFFYIRWSKTMTTKTTTMTLQFSSPNIFFLLKFILWLFNSMNSGTKKKVTQEEISFLLFDPNGSNGMDVHWNGNEIWCKCWNGSILANNTVVEARMADCEISEEEEEENPFPI